MIKVYISPDYIGLAEHKDRGGIRRVCEGMMEHLHKFGVEVSHNPDDAHIICNHATSLVERSGVPMVNVNHGLMWSRQPWGDGMHDVNRELVESMRRSVAWTAPSDWVNRAIRRGAYFYPETVYHGVNQKEFYSVKNHGGYVLWNKLRADHVSDPQDMMLVANRMPDTQFQTTIGHNTNNVNVIGTVAHENMKDIIARAGVYLSTARETFGIGILEAMACGVPIAGFDWGGNSEIVVQGYTGYLAPPGDYAGLSECIKLCFADREKLSKNCIEDISIRWGWEPRIQQYANIFKRVYEKYYTSRPTVSVIVTAYKLDQYLPKCLQSVMEQTFRDFECLVIDDANLESTKTIVASFSKKDKRIRYLSTPNNFGLVGARNFGFDNAKGLYIRHLDADDWLAENALELEVYALDNNPKGERVDIAYGHLESVREDGSQNVGRDGNVVRGGWPPENFNWYQQMAHMNQIPSCVMARREVFECSGGYRERMHRNEDADFWCRVTSLGFRARKITQAVTYYHRERQDSKGAQEWKNEGGEPDWTAWFPWRLGATDYRTAMNIFKQLGEVPRNPHIVPFGAQGKPPTRFWYIHDYAYPVVSIIVTCGPGHKRYLLDALDSIQAQNYPDWECVVVNDTAEVWPSDIMGAPWARVVNMGGNKGAATARNEGFKYVRGKFIVWMDADDYWFPWFLERMVLYAEYNNNSVIYSDFLRMIDKKTFKPFHYIDHFDPRALRKGCALPGSSVLIPREIVQAIIEKQGGWDTQIPGLEDWDYQLAICHAGFCFHHVQEPLFVYRQYSTTKREKDHAMGDKIAEYIEKKYNEDAWLKIFS